jgi:hypothetical protein
MSVAAAYYKTIPEHKAPWLLPIRLRRSQLQKLARHRRDDPAFPWAEWADAAGNESLFLESGVYKVKGERQTWAAASPECVLCYGKNRPFHTPAEVPKHILTEVRKGVARAHARAAGRRVMFTGADLGNKVGMTWELRDELKAWHIWPAGATQEYLDEARKERARQKRASDKERRMTNRRNAGIKPRAEYLEQAALRREACELAGISDKTFQRRSQSARDELLTAARAARFNVLSSVADNVLLSKTLLRTRTHGTIVIHKNRPHIIMGEPNWREKIAAFLFECESAAASAQAYDEPPPPLSADPPPTVEPEDAPPPDPTRWDWPREPVEGWRDGWLEIRNCLTGKESKIDLRAKEDVWPEGELSAPYWETEGHELNA